jgi:type VI secretion system secreted protein Hcp
MEGVMKRYAYFLVAVFVIGLFCLALATEAEATDIFVKIAGIPGESRDKRHRNWIYAESISQQIEGRGTIHVGSGRGSGRAQFDFVVVKKIDKATPKLNLYCADGRHISEVRIELVRRGGNKPTYMEYRLQDVVVTSVRTGTTKGKLGTEEVALSFGKITCTYTEFAPSGKAAGDVGYTWDLRKNRAE